jgi:hypothetical protein
MYAGYQRKGACAKIGLASHTGQPLTAQSLGSLPRNPTVGRDSEMTELGAWWGQLGIKDLKVRYPQ